MTGENVETSSTSLGRSARFHTALCWVLAALPFLYLVVMLVRYHLDAPYLDQWEFVPLLAKSYEGTISFNDLWAQHNEHRIIFPRIIMLILARLSHWNIAWELAANVVLALGLFAVLAHQINLTQKRLEIQGAIWLIPIVSLLVFSLSQWQNWFLGWQLTELLNVLAVTAGFLLLADPRFGWTRFTGALALGVVATHSFATGLAFWPIGLLSLFIVVPDSRRALMVRVAVWALVGGATILSYVYGYHAPEHHPSVWIVLSRPFEYGLYVLKYLGSPIDASSGAGAALAALVALGVFCFYGAALVRHYAVPLKHLAPYVSLGLYAVASAMMTGMGRLDFGGSQALSSRYVTFSSLLWVAVIVWVYVGIARERSREKRAFSKSAVMFLAILFAYCLVNNSVYGTFKWTERYRHKLPAQTELVSGANPDLLQRLHPNPEIVLERREILRKHGLSVFRK